VTALADTSVLIEYLRGSVQARALLRRALERGETVYGSVLTRIELSVGMRERERKATDDLVAALSWIPVDRAIADDADALARQYGQSYSGIDAVDYCIAATKRQRSLEFWTLNMRHFPMFPDLQRPW
jgi:predicted nucleic acid-binding protein